MPKTIVAKKSKTPTNAKKSPLTAAWKKAFDAGWVEDCYPSEEMLNDEDVASEREEVVHVPLASHRVGNAVIVPTMSDDNGIATRVLAVVGFKQTKAVDVNMGNPSCTTLVYEEDPKHTGPRGLLLVVHNEALTWLVMLT